MLLTIFYAEVFDTCSSLYDNFRPVAGRSTIGSSGRYVIDPDGPFGVNPFEVICDFPYKTTLFITSKMNT